MGLPGYLAKDCDGVRIVKKGGLPLQVLDIAAIDKDANITADAIPIQKMGPKIGIGFQ